MTVNQVHLFRDAVPSQLLVELQKASGLKRLVMFVKSLFAGLQEVWSSRRKSEIQLPGLPDSFQGSEKQHAVLYDWPSQIGAGIPAQKERGAVSGDIGGIERAVAMEAGDQSVPLAGAAFAHNVYDSARSMAELRVVAGGENLELQNRILVKRGCGPAINCVVVGHAVYKKNGVPASFPQCGHRGVQAGICLPVDCDAGDQLHQVKVVPPIDWHLLDLLGQDGGAR